MVKLLFSLFCCFSLLASSAFAVNDQDLNDFYSFEITGLEQDNLSSVESLSIDNLFAQTLTLSADDTAGSLGSYASNLSYVAGGASTFGNGYLYLPKSAKDSFGISSGHLVNTSGSSITGSFITDSGITYSVSFASLAAGRARYPSSGTSSQTIDFIFRPDVTDTNMTLTSSNASPFTNTTELLLYCILILLGVKHFA